MCAARDSIVLISVKRQRSVNVFTLVHAERIEIANREAEEEQELDKSDRWGERETAKGKKRRDSLLTVSYMYTGQRIIARTHMGSDGLLML